LSVALITGITGQDGIHLTKFLLEKGYKIHGIISGRENEQYAKFQLLFPSVTLHHGDLADSSSLIRVINAVRPTEIYNLGAISFVGMSFLQPEFTSNITGLGCLRLLESVRQLNLEDKIKFYQASSSEMFGKVKEAPQNEKTPFYPSSPYGVAKTFAHYTSVNYREAYGMFISMGILFNHEGEYRGHDYVTRKISSNIARIKLGKQKKFSLGDLSAQRDWGYAGDYVDAMWRMLQHDNADDFVVATGKTFTVRNFVETAIKAAELPGQVEDYVNYDVRMVRPTEVNLLVGDASKAKELLGWEPSTNFENLVDIMVVNDLRIEALRS
jgi:GDPmannose 4,6-dehydratase